MRVEKFYSHCTKSKAYQNHLLLVQAVCLQVDALPTRVYFNISSKSTAKHAKKTMA